MDAEQMKHRYCKPWTEEQIYNVFVTACEYARNEDECLCLEDAIAQTDMPYSTYYAKSKSDKTLEAIKTDTMRHILRRINKNTLTGNFIAAGGIWRMKQLGEEDKQTSNVNMSGELNLPITKWADDNSEPEV